MEFRILGPLEVIDDGDAVRLGGAKVRSVLVMLLLNVNQPVSQERLALALWGEDAPAGAVKTVQVHISRLRKALGDETVLVTTPVGYRLRVRPGELDADRFRSLARDGRLALADGRIADAAARLHEALDVWRGPALADVAYEPFAQNAIAALEEERLNVVNSRVEADLAAGRHGEVLGELQRRVAASPTNELVVRQLMLALYRCGRQPEALDVYTRTRALLSCELGLEPGPALRSLQRDILGQAPSLDFLPPEPADVADDGGPATALPLPSALVASAAGTFVGRAADLEALTRVYADVADGARRLALVCGEPGIGKTRLAAEFARSAHERGAIVLYGRCDEEGLLALQPFVEALRHYVSTCPVQLLAGRLQPVSAELRRILPELAGRVPGMPDPIVGDPEGARTRLFEAVGSLLCEAAQATPIVLVLDDLHWADPATLLLLKYVLRHPRHGQLMLLGTYRDTELHRDHRLGGTLAELGRENELERRALAPLDAAAVSELVGAHIGAQASSELRRMVYEGTEGNAFFVVELLRHLAESGWGRDVQCDTAPPTGPPLSVPDRVRDVIRRRVSRLGDEADRLLATASVLGSTFELRVLKRLTGVAEDELLDVLDSAVHAQVIDELSGGPGSYAFSHAMIRDTLYAALSATRRALIHRRAATALEAEHADDLDGHLAELAHHFAEAGSSADIDKAIAYGSRAGLHATSRLAYEQAAAQFRRTVQLIDAAGLAAMLRAQRCDLVIAQGEAERRAGDLGYRRTLLEAARLAHALSDPGRLARAALANNRGVYSSGQGIDRERVATLEAALDAYDVADSATRAALLAMLALELVTADDGRLRDRLRDEALAMARRLGDPRTLAIVLTQRWVSQWSPSQTDAERASNLHEAIELSDRLDDPLLAGHAAYLGAHAAMNRGDLEEADRLMARLCGVADQLGQPFMRWYAAVARAKRSAICGPADEAERCAYEALQIGRRGGHPDCELWFLGQLFAARFIRGTLDGGEPHLPDLVGSPGQSIPAGDEITQSRSVPLMVGAAMSVILCEVGRLDDARGHFELLMSTGLTQLTPDYTAHLIPVYASIACARLGDKRRARRLLELLEPHSDRLVTTGASWFGATTHYLGLLAATLGRREEAQARFTEAERTYMSLGAEPWLARLRHDRRMVLPSEQQEGDGARDPHATHTPVGDGPVER